MTGAGDLSAGTEDKFLDWNKQKVDWDNEDHFEDTDGLVEEDPAHPEIPVELPGIDLVSEQTGDHEAIEVIPPKNAQLGHAELRWMPVWKIWHQHPAQECRWL